jgi:hypothetical protein
MKTLETRKDNWTEFDKYPPILVRLLAREKTSTKSVRALTNEEISIRSGIVRERVEEISRMLEWECPLHEARLFCTGCSFDPLDALDRNRAGAYLRGGPKWTYLRAASCWRNVFVPLVTILRENPSVLMRHG